MSVPKRRLILADPAQRDLRSIAIAGINTWGLDRSERYHAEIKDLLASLTSFPELGRRRDDDIRGIRSIAIKEHVVHYRYDDQAVTVLRILHRRMNTDEHLPAPE